MNVLTVDGGGIRGVIPGLVLAALEERTGKQTAELFDLIAGTSTGGIIACALARPNPMAASGIAEVYTVDGPKIFERRLGCGYGQGFHLGRPAPLTAVASPV